MCQEKLQMTGTPTTKSIRSRTSGGGYLFSIGTFVIRNPQS